MDDIEGSNCLNGERSAAAVADAPAPSNATSCNDDEKYSEAYFTHRIRELRDKISSTVPSKEFIDPNRVFLSILQSYELSRQSLDAFIKVLDGLEKENEEHKDVINPAVIDAAKSGVEHAQDTANGVSKTATKIGSNLNTTSGLLKILRTNKDLQHDLLECTVLVQSTPLQLAKWCAEDPEQNRAFLDVFLANHGCMKGFLLAGGPVHGNFGPAIVICGKLHLQLKEQGVGKRKKLLQRLALAIALEHASPIPIWKKENAEQVDPFERFWHYADAHLDGSLDPAFEELSVWELRLVVDSNATHEDLTWAREYLKAYRPDEVLTSDEQWRYVMAVKSDVGYRHPSHEFENYKDLVSAGGKCGARAWFGRFVCKAWGIPTWGIRQPGHAAMSRWTRDGWKICLGAPKWEISWWDETRYSGAKGTPKRCGPDFLEETLARKTANSCCRQSYEDVILLECLAESFGETVADDFVSEKFWRSLAVAERKFVAMSLTNNSDIDDVRVTAPSTVSDIDTEGEQIRVQSGGRIVIPAASFKKKSGNATCMDSFLGGKQLHFLKKSEVMVEYELPATTKRGRYSLSVKIVNVHREQAPMLINVDHPSSHGDTNSPEDFEFVSVVQSRVLTIPYTMGSWQTTEEMVEFDLGPELAIQLSRKEPCWGLSMKEIVLTPL